MTFDKFIQNHPELKDFPIDVQQEAFYQYLESLEYSMSEE